MSLRQSHPLHSSIDYAPPVLASMSTIPDLPLLHMSVMNRKWKEASIKTTTEQIKMESYSWHIDRGPDGPQGTAWQLVTVELCTMRQGLISCCCLQLQAALKRGWYRVKSTLNMVQNTLYNKLFLGWVTSLPHCVVWSGLCSADRIQLVWLYVLIVDCRVSFSWPLLCNLFLLCKFEMNQFLMRKKGVLALHSVSSTWNVNAPRIFKTETAHRVRVSKWSLIHVVWREGRKGMGKLIHFRVRNDLCVSGDSFLYQWQSFNVWEDLFKRVKNRWITGTGKSPKRFDRELPLSYLFKSRRIQRSSHTHTHTHTCTDVHYPTQTPTHVPTLFQQGTIEIVDVHALVLPQDKQF